MADRCAKLSRKTKETDISVGLNIDGTGKSNIDTGIGFFNHMLEGFSKHGFFDLDMTCDGDLNVDCHHTIEDCHSTGCRRQKGHKEIWKLYFTDG